MSGVVEIATARGTRRVSLSECLDAVALEQSQLDARAWIKALRQLEVDGVPLRSRFTVDGDSLWWFTELYLHKEQAILTAMRVIAALERVTASENPSELRWIEGSPRAASIASAFAASRGLAFAGPPNLPLQMALARASSRARAHLLHTSTRARRHSNRQPRPVRIAGFVHRAFFDPDRGTAGGERYIGRVLEALEQKAGREALQLIAIGPRRNFRARRWWDPLFDRDTTVRTIEGFAPPGGRSRSDAIWRARRGSRRALLASDAIRTHAIIRGVDCWPVVREQLEGVVYLQWPWSVWAMDCAAAALDALAPSVCVTYAEAGGWGRALALECRRRGIPLAAIQHGFIYRHWLNYLHEPDEVQQDPHNATDPGFPRPTLTLVFDAFTAAHLTRNGHFPPDSLRIVGSAERDELAQMARQLDEAARADVRDASGVPPGQHLVVCATKFAEAKRVLPLLVNAIQRTPGVHLVIKAHPAETADVYEPLSRTGVTILPASTPLLPLVASARAIVTVNSTVAVDALGAGVPALTLGQPNNLTPFVEAGAMAGAPDDPGAIATAIRELVNDEARRATLIARGEALIGTGPGGRAAEACADAILSLTSRGVRPGAA